MKLIDKLLNCTDENGWRNPNFTRAENLEIIADEFAIGFAEWVTNSSIKNTDLPMEVKLKMYKNQKKLK